jgi:hypothetical protein
MEGAVCIVLEPVKIYICDLFYDAVSSSDYTASNNRITNEWWIEKDVEGSGRGQKRLLSQNLSGETEKNNKTPQWE